MESKIKVKTTVTKTEEEEWILKSSDDVDPKIIMVHTSDFDEVKKIIREKTDFY